VCVCTARDFSNVRDESSSSSSDGECIRPPTLRFLSPFSLFSLALSCVHRCSLYLFFEPDTRVIQSYTFGQYEREREKKEKKANKKWFHRCRSLYMDDGSMSDKMTVLDDVRYSGLDWNSTRKNQGWERQLIETANTSRSVIDCRMFRLLHIELHRWANSNRSNEKWGRERSVLSIEQEVRTAHTLQVIVYVWWNALQLQVLVADRHMDRFFYDNGGGRDGWG
jgi:hypothetical protein